MQFPHRYLLALVAFVNVAAPAQRPPLQDALLDHLVGEAQGKLSPFARLSMTRSK